MFPRNHANAIAAIDLCVVPTQTRCRPRFWHARVLITPCRLDNTKWKYNLAAPNGLAARLMGYQRRRIFASFMARTNAGASATILDVGATADRSYATSNYIEQWYPSRTTITAVGVDDACFLFIPACNSCASGLALPFNEQAIDLGHFSAVLEHVGSSVRQLAFVRECCRVAARGVFLTTPNDIALAVEQ
jgi:hypothetical protein